MDHWIGIASLVISAIGLILTICTLVVSQSTKRAVLSHKTLQDYEEYKSAVLNRLKVMRDELARGEEGPEYRPQIVEIVSHLEGYKEHYNKVTREAVVELKRILGMKTTRGELVRVSFMGAVFDIIPSRSASRGQEIANALSKLIGGLESKKRELLE